MTRLLVVLALTAAGLGGCRGERPPNVVLILIDTLRAQNVSSYGYDRLTSPFLDEFGAAGILFENAHSQASCTYPSVNSLLTSQYPGEFLGESDFLGIHDEMPSLPTMLRAHGYRTVAVSASPIVRRSASAHNPGGGFDAGFDEFSEICEWSPAECVNAEILRLVADHAGPQFLYAHYIDPHDPYAPPHETRHYSAVGYPAAEEGPYPDWVEAGNPNPLADALYRGGAEVVWEDRDIRRLVDLYDDEIRHVDGAIRELFARLEETAFLDNALIVIASDHGEHFMEHGHIKHCRTVHEVETRVPLFMRLPGHATGRRVRTAVQNLDVVPTLLAALGIDASPYDLKGRDLLPMIDGEDVPGTMAFALQGVYRSVAGDRYKLIADLDTAQYEIFDLQADPGEIRDLVTAGELPPGLEARMVARFRERLELDPRAAERSADAMERLRALGYIQ